MRATSRARVSRHSARPPRRVWSSSVHGRVNPNSPPAGVASAELFGLRGARRLRTPELARICDVAALAASVSRFNIAVSEERPRATRAVEGRLRGSAWMRPLPSAPDPHDRRVRRRQRRRRPDVHRRGARCQRGPDGAAVRRTGGEAARQDAGRDLDGPERGVYLQHLEMQASRQPRPASERDRGVSGLPAQPG